MSILSEYDLAQYLDQTNLDPSIVADEMAEFVQEAANYRFRSVAIMPSWVPLATNIVTGTNTTIVAAIGYPLGTCTTDSKVAETHWVINNGPDDLEIDMVLNVPFLKSRLYRAVTDDIAAVVDAAGNHIVKVIIEVPILTADEVVIASMLVEDAGADYVKTSTGFKPFKGSRPATAGDIKIIKSAVGDEMKIKAAGGIRTLSQALRILEAGADRIGTSSGIPIIESFRVYSNN